MMTMFFENDIAVKITSIEGELIFGKYTSLNTSIFQTSILRGEYNNYVVVDIMNNRYNSYSGKIIIRKIT